MQEAKPLSFTKVSQYLSCPLSYKFKYIDKYEQAQNMNFILGDALHKALEYNDNYWIAKGKHLPITKIQAKYLTVLNKNVGQIPDITTDQIKEAEIMGKAMISSYIKDIQQRKDYKPKVLEQAFDFIIEGTNVRIKGFIDVITEDGYIDDRKTASKPYKVLKTMRGVQIENPETGRQIFDGDEIKKYQLMIYALWYRQTFGVKEKGTRYDVILKEKNTVQHIDVLFSDTELEIAKQKLIEVAEKIEKQEFPPHVSYACRWCDFRDKCPTISPDIEHANYFP